MKTTMVQRPYGNPDCPQCKKPQSMTKREHTYTRTHVLEMIDELRIGQQTIDKLKNLGMNTFRLQITNETLDDLVAKLKEK